jgi:hypothetical protein
MKAIAHRFCMPRSLPPVDVPRSSGIRQVVPSERVRHLAEITYTLRNYYAQTADNPICAPGPAHAWSRTVPAVTDTPYSRRGTQKNNVVSIETTAGDLESLTPQK